MNAMPGKKNPKIQVDLSVIELVIAMRKAQRKYFARRDSASLERSKQLERLLDTELESLQKEIAGYRMAEEQGMVQEAMFNGK